MDRSRKVVHGKKKFNSEQWEWCLDKPHGANTQHRCLVLSLWDKPTRKGLLSWAWRPWRRDGTIPGGHGHGAQDHARQGPTWFEKAEGHPPETWPTLSTWEWTIAWLEIRRRFFREREIESWIKIPVYLKSETNNVLFRSKYKTVRVIRMQPAAVRN